MRIRHLTVPHFGPVRGRRRRPGARRRRRPCGACGSTRHRQPGLTAVAGLTGNVVQQQRPAGDGLAVVIGLGQTDEQAPPVIDRGDQPGHVPETLQVTRGEAAPAPLVSSTRRRHSPQPILPVRGIVLICRQSFMTDPRDFQQIGRLCRFRRRFRRPGPTVAQEHVCEDDELAKNHAEKVRIPDAFNVE